MAGLIVVKPRKTMSDTASLQRIVEQHVNRAREIAKMKGVQMPRHIHATSLGNWDCGVPWNSKKIRDCVLEALEQDARLNVK